MATQEKYPNRWVQLALGIICMATVANCQYGWTLFVAPIEDKYHWARTAIQLSFTIFLFSKPGWFLWKDGALTSSARVRSLFSVLFWLPSAGLSVPRLPAWAFCISPRS